jgi:hypothetical protein
MPYYLSVEVESSLPPDEFRDRIMVPLRLALEREGVGSLLEGQPDNSASPGLYELAVSSTDQERCRQIVEEILRSVDTSH